MSRVLLVDDNKDLMNIAKGFLAHEEPNFGLTMASSTSEALQMLMDECLDAVVVDERMPEMDDLELP